MSTDIEQDAGGWKSSDVQLHGDMREAQVIDPAVEKRVVRKCVAPILYLRLFDGLQLMHSG
jgi:hypothetical protein